MSLVLYFLSVVSYSAVNKTETHISHRMTLFTIPHKDLSLPGAYLIHNLSDLLRLTLHYENTPIQIYRRFHLQKLKIKVNKNPDIFHISAQNIDCGYSLEPPRRGGSNEYPQSMFSS